MNTRVTVPLSKEVYEAVTLLSDISGQSRGAFLADTIGAAAPSYLKIAAAYRRAASLEGNQRRKYLEGMKHAEVVLLDVLQRVTTEFDNDLASSEAAPTDGGSVGCGEASTPDVLTGGFPPLTEGS